MELGSMRAARTAQVSAQALTGTALLLSLPAFDLFNALFLAAALVVTLRKDGTPNDGAVSNFAASMLVAGGILEGLLDSIGGSPGESLGPSISAILLVATVLFALAGAFYWLQRNRTGS